MQPPIRVAQWATGGVGRAAIQDVLAHPDLELVGAWVHSEDKDGRDVGEIIGGHPIGVLATTDRQAIIDGDADCVVYSPLMPDEAEVVALLRAGKNVVTPVGWVNPDPATTGDLEAACAEGDSTLHGTGIHPGGITERFPLMVSALSAGVTHVRSEEFSDIRTYGAPDVIRHIMAFGATPEEARDGMIVGLLSGGFKQSVRMIADEMGFDIDPELTTVHEVAVATEPIPSPIGDIQPGLVAGQRFSWQATVRGEVVITATVNWLMGEGALDPPWEIRPRGGAVRGRGHRRPEREADVQGAPAGDHRGGTGPQPGRRVDRQPLRERHPVRRRRRAGHQDLPRPATDRGPRRSGPGQAVGRVSILDSFRLDGKVAVVTGGGQGIGRGIAIGFAEAGADVVVGARTQADLDEVVTRVEETGRRALAVVTDVLVAEDRERLVAAAVDRFGRLDVLVNNAGGTGPRAAMQTSERFMEMAMRFNVVSPLLMSQLAAQAMVDTAGSGSIVNISSRSADLVMPSFVAYGAGKAALNQLTRNLAVELAPLVRVNAIGVGGVATKGLEVVLTDDALRAEFEANTPMHRPGQPEDIACAALYFASPASAWVTGKVLQVDGGTEKPSMEVPVPPLAPSAGVE